MLGDLLDNTLTGLKRSARPEQNCQNNAIGPEPSAIDERTDRCKKNDRMRTLYKIVHVTEYSYSAGVPVCHNELHLSPRATPTQSPQSHRVHIRPKPASTVDRFDYFGNPLMFVCLQGSHHRLLIEAESRVEVRPRPVLDLASSIPWDQLRERMQTNVGPAWHEAVQYLFDSPHVITSDAVARYALSSFVPHRPILEATQDLTSRIYREFDYDPTSTTISTPVDEVLSLRRGVCQDFAHLQIACLRAMGLPARYVSGYLRTTPPPGKPRLQGADASHAWVSVFTGETGWVDFDPTNDCLVGEDHITTAWGRDYTDVCPVKGVFVGGGSHSMRVSVDVTCLESVPSGSALDPGVP